MLHVTGARLRLLLAAMAGTCLLLFGAAASASASTYADLQGAKAGDEVALSENVSLIVGAATTGGGTTTISDASLDFGGGVQGSGVTGTLSGDALTLKGGDFAVPKTLSTQVHTIDANDPFVVSFSGGDVSNITGELVSTEQEAGSPPALRAFGANEVEPDDVAQAVPPAAAGDRFRFSLSYTLISLKVPTNSNSWFVQVFLNRNNVELEGAVISGRVYGNQNYRYEFNLNYPAIIQGRTVDIAGRLTGDNLFQPSAITGISGSITGELELTKGVFFTGGSVSWDASGFTLSGGARVDCRDGSVSGNLAGAYEDDRNWSLELTGGTNNGCVVSDDLQLPAGDLTGRIEKADGKVTGLFEVEGVIQTPLLPAGVNEWNARFGFIYDGTDAGSYVEFKAEAGIGTAQGKVDFDGTLALSADFTIPFGGSSVAFDGTINRSTPGGPVTYDVGGSADIAIGSKGNLAGSVRLTNDSLAFSGNVTLACPVSGSVTGGVSTTVPLNGGNDWSVAITGGAGANGCGVTDEFSLGAGTGVTGEVTSVAGVVSVGLDANATITTTLIPTKTSFSAGFTFAASQGAYSVAVNGSTQGAGFSASVKSDGRFDLSFNLSDLALGGVSLGAKGTINRTVVGGPVAYAISGSLAGEAKIYENLYLQSGSLSISNTGGLSFSGSVRQKCTTGNLVASASGQITDSRNWSFTAKGVASACTIGRAAAFNGNAFNATIDSVDAKVAYNAGISVARINLFSTRFLLIGQTTTWLTNVSGSLSNTCAGCQADGRIRLTFRGTGNAQFKVLILPTTVSATVDGSVDIRGTSVRRVDIRITKIGWNFLTFGVQAALVTALDCDVEKGFTTA